MKLIRVFSTKECRYCPALKKWLDSKGIRYEEIDRDTHPIVFQRMINETGLLTVPVTLINGRYIAGMNIGELSKVLREIGVLS